VQPIHEPVLIDELGRSPCELIGFSIEGPAPLGAVHIPARRGLNVLYGLNGAGKTTVLEAIGAALTGISPGERSIDMIHLRITDPLARADEGLSGRLFEVLAESFRGWWSQKSMKRFFESRFDGSGEREENRPPPTRHVLERSPQRLIAAHLELFHGCSDPKWAEVIEAVARQAVFSLQPCGERSSAGSRGVRSSPRPGPRWQVFLSFMLGPETRLIESLVEEAVRLFVEEAAGVSGDADGNGATRETESALETELGGSDVPPIGVSFDHFGPLEEEYVGSLPACFRSADLFGELARGAGRRPAQFPYCAFYLGELGVAEGECLDGASVLLEEPADGSDVNDATLTQLIEPSSIERHFFVDRYSVLLASEQDEFVIAPTYLDEMRRLSERASSIVAGLLDDAPALRCEFRPPNDWLYSKPLRWLAADWPSLQEVPLEDLSEAQRRWAGYAVSAALAEDAADAEDTNSSDEEPCADSPTIDFAIFDEPERNLHRRAEETVARGLEELAGSGRRCIYVASHSPAFLRAGPNRHLFHVYRAAGGRTAIAEVDDILALAAEDQLGLCTEDVLSLIRVFLIVEGDHDVAVLDAVIGDSLREARTRMIPLGGTHNAMSIIDSRFLLEMTDATVVVAFDAIRRNLAKLWERARAASGDEADAADTRQAQSEMQRIAQGDRNRKGPALAEKRMLASLLLEALKSGQADRIAVATLRRPDIIEYLPAEAFVPGSTWPVLTSEWKKARSDNRGLDFKTFLRIEKGGKISTKRLGEVADSLDEIPADFIGLLETCRRAGVHTR